MNGVSRQRAVPWVSMRPRCFAESRCFQVDNVLCHRNGDELRVGDRQNKHQEGDQAVEVGEATGTAQPG
jgi:hypothetical protein